MRVGYTAIPRRNGILFGVSTRGSFCRANPLQKEHLAEMEDPVHEVEGVIRALVERPTLRRQEKTLRKYFAADVDFYHPYINSRRGIEVLIVIYQVTELMVNYRAVEFHKIVYDETENCLSVRMTVYIRPWLLLFRTIPLRFHALLEFTDVLEDGKILKKVRVQRDYFIRSPLVQAIPIVGEIYDSDRLRFWAGDIYGFVFLLLKSLVIWALRHLPQKVVRRWLGNSVEDIAVAM